MADAPTRIAHRPVWVDISSSDPEAARNFYSRLFGWEVEVTDDPQYGGYGIAKVGGQDVAGIGSKQSPEMPTTWSLYIGTDDVDGLAQRFQEAGGTVIAPPFDVGDTGRMGVFQDVIGAFISAWQPNTMGGFAARGANAFGWAELYARGVDTAIPFYEQVFGWTHRTSPMEGQPPYTEFLLGEDSVAGAMEMNEMVPAEVPSYWMIYFAVDDVDQSFRTAVDAGAHEMVAPQDFPGGRFAIVSDPEGAVFGLLRMAAGE